MPVTNFFDADTELNSITLMDLTKKGAWADNLVKFNHQLHNGWQLLFPKEGDLKFFYRGDG